MKDTLVGTLFVFALILVAADAGAAWLIDEERYHVSIHGRISCQECHSDIIDKSLHPDPAEVNNTLRDFYRSEQCISCHADVPADVNDGSHGGERIPDKKDFTFCIGCHDPHYQLSYIDAATNLDLTQPKEKKCSICHELQNELPQFLPEDEQCMGCHRSMTSEAAGATAYISELCFHCHADSAISKKPGNFARIDAPAYGTTAHSDITCTICHLQAVEFQHVNQKLGDCRQCHLPHDEKVAHDAHVRIACEACHLNQVSAVRDSEGGRIQWQINRHPDELSAIHSMVISNEDVFCRRCHFDGNTIGAAAMVLPAKSLMCMPCHTATFSVGDTTTLIALIIFGFGIFATGSIWLSGSLAGSNAFGVGGKLNKAIQSITAVVFSGRIFTILAALIMDGLLQRRLFRVSRIRWFIHALIFFPFLFRFCWGLTALAGSIWLPERQGIWLMLDKNHPLTAFVFDLTGVLAILGIAMILVRKYAVGSEGRPRGLPKADWLAYGLMGGIIIVGFILEGMRIGMTGTPQGSQYAFLGYVISRLFSELNLTVIYGYMWYMHTILTGAFVAYLPFSRMFHMIMAPVALAINAASEFHKETIKSPLK